MMSRNRWVAAAALLVTSTGALAAGPYEFDSITVLHADFSSVTGVLVNDTAPTTLTVNSYGGCKDWLELMMKQPGMFTLSFKVVPSGPEALLSITACILRAKP